MRRALIGVLIGLAFGWGQPVAAALFVVHYTTGPAWVHGMPFREQKHAHAHSEILAKHREAGHIVFGARFRDTGMIVVRADSEEWVRKMVERDPAVSEGTFYAEIDAFRPFYGGCIGSPVSNDP